MKYSILLLLVFSFYSNAQTKYDIHDELLFDAYDQKESGNCELALQTYRSAIELIKPSSGRSYFLAAECAIKIGKMEVADEWIRMGVTQAGAPLSYLREFDGFQNVQNETFYKTIIADYNILRRQYFSSIENIDLYNEVEQLTFRDQFVRKTGMYLDGISEQDYQEAGDGFSKAREEKDTIKGKEFKKILFHQTAAKYNETTTDLMQKVDSLNIARLMEITAEHGWQSRAWIILWHQRGTYGEDNYVWNYFKPVIDEEIAVGTMSRSFWDTFDQFKEIMETGTFGTIQLGERPKIRGKTEEKN
ncbi:hypothetical protein [Nonlabens antarcticus]|uniref:hypothetical protein n=1 Tax=Nonlabens antarcticus TaxID=392714 RepID=UPI0018914907|nr:hypothetical protein [Nonlabens antarcticus]